MGPLGIKTSRKGDRVSASVAQPGALKGDTVEGTVNEVRSGGKLHGNSVLNLSFEALRDSKGQAEDSTGDAAQSEIDAERLTADGLGATKRWKPTIPRKDARSIGALNS